MKLSVNVQNMPYPEEIMAGAAPTREGFIIDIPNQNIPKEVKKAIDNHSIVSIVFIKE